MSNTSGGDFRRRSIAYCQEQDVLLVADEIVCLDALVEVEDDKYLNLIETEDWFLRSQQGELEKILIPFFGLENHINWRPNFLYLG